MPHKGRHLVPHTIFQCTHLGQKLHTETQTMSGTLAPAPHCLGAAYTLLCNEVSNYQSSQLGALHAPTSGGLGLTTIHKMIQGHQHDTL
jgi:hypothetical protein